MAQRDTGTEHHIKETAKRIFFSEGKLHATTQEIADAAGVNRTLLNYYFRSRDVLFEQVATEARQELSRLLDLAMAASIPFKEKLERMIRVFMEQCLKYPYREMFLVREFNKFDKIIPEEKKEVVQAFLKEIEKEMEEGRLKKMDPRHFCMNLFSLMAYPMITKCLQKSIFNMDEATFLELMEERQQIIFDILYTSPTEKYKLSITSE